MPHRARFMVEASPGKWVIECRVCRSRNTKRIYPAARECHDYWREHEATPDHQRDSAPDERHRRQRLRGHNKRVKLMEPADWGAHVADCEFCGPTRRELIARGWLKP